MKRIAMAAVLLVMLVGPARAGFDEGVIAHERGDYETALKEFRPLAEQGSTSAQSNLGTMYENGYGVPQDYAEAVKWYRKAAEQGYASAQTNLGTMYAKGHGVTQDYVQAHMWFNLAAAQGNAVGRKNRDKAAELNTDWRTAAYVLALTRLETVYKERGIFP